MLRNKPDLSPIVLKNKHTIAQHSILRLRAGYEAWEDDERVLFQTPKLSLMPQAKLWRSGSVWLEQWERAQNDKLSRLRTWRALRSTAVQY